MENESSDTGLRERIAGAAIAGLGAVVVMLVLTSGSVATPTVRAIVAILAGVGLAQVYEHLLT